MIIASAGHVDHGKTALIKALTGIDTDRLEEEKARGLSIVLGFAYRLLADGRLLAFVDVPGHEKFISNMLSGVAGIDLCLLVVAADDGVMPQTVEHVTILKLLGIDRFIIALTKIDRASSERVLKVSSDISLLFNEFPNLNYEIFPVSTIKREGLPALEKALINSIDFINTRNSDQYFRMAVDRVFTIQGKGVVVTGTIFSGCLNRSDYLTVSSNGSEVRVRGIRVHKKDVERVEAGERCALNLVGRRFSVSSIRRGAWLTHRNLYIPTARIDVELYVLKTENHALKHWTPVHFYIGADHSSARVAILSSSNIAPGDKGLAQIVLPRDTFAVSGDHFVLRDQSAKRTLAGGRVLDPHAPKRGRRKGTRVAKLLAMGGENHHHILKVLVEQSKSGISFHWFSTTFNVSENRINEIATSLDFMKIGKSPKNWIYSSQNWIEMLRLIESRVKFFHQVKPTLLGPTTEAIHLSLKIFLDRTILELALNMLVLERKLFLKDNRFYLPSHNVDVSKCHQALLKTLLNILEPESGAPPSPSQIANKLGLEVKVIEKTLKIGIHLGDILKIGKGRYVSKKMLNKLKSMTEMLARASTDGEFTVVKFCEESGIGRNFSIVVLEYFDQIGFTSRAGNYRRIQCDPDSPSLINREI